MQSGTVARRASTKMRCGRDAGHPTGLQIIGRQGDDLGVLRMAAAVEVATGTWRRHRARLYGRTATGLLRYHYWMADNLLSIAERGPALVHAHNSHLQREKSTMQMWQGPVEWWGAGALVNARLGGEYAHVATALGTIRHRGVGTPPPDTVEGLLYALPEDRCVIDAPRLATALAGIRPAARVSPWFGYAPLDPAHLAGSDGLLFVKDVPQR